MSRAFPDGIVYAVWDAVRWETLSRRYGRPPSGSVVYPHATLSSERHAGGGTGGCDQTGYRLFRRRIARTVPYLITTGSQEGGPDFSHGVEFDGRPRLANPYPGHPTLSTGLIQSRIGREFYDDGLVGDGEYGYDEEAVLAFPEEEEAHSSRSVQCRGY